MSLDDRIGFLILGGVVGFVFGYIVRSLREIKEELDEVDEAVMKKKNEGGFIRNSVVSDIALLVVIVLTIWAAFSSQRASNDIQSTQDDLARVSTCNEQYLAKTIAALNERTTFSQAQANANVELQKAQAEFLSVLLSRPPAKHSDRQAALSSYFSSLTKFVKVSGKTDQKVEENPYPTNEELEQCLHPS